MKTVSYKEYVRELEITKAQLEEKTGIEAIFERIWIVNIGSDNKIQMGINVAGTGDVSNAYARRFARCIEIATTLAERFKYNGYAVE